MQIIKGLPYTQIERTPYRKSGPGGPDGGPPPPPPGMENAKPTRAALEIRNGAVVAQDPALTGTVSATLGTDLRLLADSDELGGVFVSGEGSVFTLEHANIRLSGDTSGFDTKLCGAAVDDHAALTIRNSRIQMDGRQRLATAASNNSVLKVYDSTLISHGAPWPADEPEVNYVMNGNMSKAPVFLEIEGNMRTHCTVGNSRSYFHDSTIIADSWAALSTDIADGQVYLEANNCHIITTRGGYGTYADTDCHSVLRSCTLDVAHMAGIISGEARLELIDCKAKCGNYVVLNHVVGGGDNDSMLTQVSDISIVGGRYQCEDAAVIVKSCNADIRIERADIRSFANILLKSRVNDDPCAPDASSRDVYGIHAALKNGAYAGDVQHTDVHRNMYLTLDHASLSGAITGGVLLTLGEGGTWTATGNSDVVLHGDLDLSRIDAEQGVTITAAGMEETEVQLPSGGVLRVIQKN